MQFFKTIISLLLLLTYSFGFAHNLVPHCSDFSDENHTHAPAHKHHQHAEGEEHNTEHSHITHNDHFDEGVYGFIVCLVNETDNPETECSVEHCFTINSSNNLMKVNKLQTAIILFTIFQPIVQDEAIINCFKNIEINYLSPPLEDSPHRGPPIYSC